MDILLVASQMIMLASMMAVGYIVTKKKWITPTVSSGLSALTANVFNPILVIDSVIGQSIAETGSLFWENLVLVLFFYIILFIAGWVIVFVIGAKKSDYDKYRMLTLFPNCGFMGIPVIASLLGKQYVIYVAIYMLIYNLILYTYGISIVKRSTKNASQKEEGTDNTAAPNLVKQLLLNPGLISAAIALIIFFTGITLPDTLCSFINYMGSPCIPMSMLLIGYSIAESDLKKIVKNVRMYAYIVLRQLVLPISMCFLMRLIPYDEAIKTAFVILISMPAGSMTAIITQEHGGDTEFIAGGIVLTTVTSLITLPVVSIFI